MTHGIVLYSFHIFGVVHGHLVFHLGQLALRFSSVYNNRLNTVCLLCVDKDSENIDIQFPISYRHIKQTGGERSIQYNWDALVTSTSFSVSSPVYSDSC